MCGESERASPEPGMLQPRSIPAAASLHCTVTTTTSTACSPCLQAVELAEALTGDERVRLCGLGPRDSLRLEAGLCLYGEALEQHL